MSAIFLSYRRDDSAGYAGRLFDNLADRFGRERVFMDIETLEPGLDFVAGIERAIASCGAVIAMIGPNWLDAVDEDGRRRLDDEHDFIRLEIATALDRGVRVIPVLVHNARMPPANELPESLRPLCRLQASEISDNRWEFDVRRLADVIEPLITDARQGPSVEPPATTTPVEATGISAPTMPEPEPEPEPEPDGRPIRWLAAVVVAAAVAVGAGYWWLSPSPPTEQPPVDQAAMSPADASHATETQTVTAAPPEAPPPTDEPEETPAGPVAVSDAVGGSLSPPAAPATEAPIAEKEPAQTPVEPPARVETPAQAPPEPQSDAVTDTVVVTVPPGPSAEELRQREIDELIQAAERDLAALRLTRPAGNNAFDRYARVLELEPDHPVARNGLIAITERYHGLVEDALGRGDPATAQRHLNSATKVDPAAAWLAPMQREIDQHRRAAEPKPEPVPGTDNRGLAACLSACESDHRACREQRDSQTEDCLREHAQTCERRYQDCMSDQSELFMGRVALESKCAGVHARCSEAAASDCAAAPQTAEALCDTRLETCNRRCEDSH